jgi:hypothetical protein
MMIMLFIVLFHQQTSYTFGEGDGTRAFHLAGMMVSPGRSTSSPEL